METHKSEGPAGPRPRSARLELVAEALRAADLLEEERFRGEWARDGGGDARPDTRDEDPWSLDPLSPLP